MQSGVLVQVLFWGVLSRARARFCEIGGACFALSGVYAGVMIRLRGLHLHVN